MKSFDLLGVRLTGTQLVEASAGTGKTHAIESLYLRLLLEAEHDVDRILVVTYTRAATAELRERIRDRLRRLAEALEARIDGRGGADDDPLVAALVERCARRVAPDPPYAAHRRLLQALARFDEAAILTIHAFCQRALQDTAFESGAPFEFELDADAAPLLRELAFDFCSRELFAASEPLARYARAKSDRLSPERLVALARRMLAHPEVRVLPARGGAGVGTTQVETETGDLEVRWLGALAQLRERWQHEREPLLDLLCQEGVLNGRIYPRGNLRQSWPPHFEQLFEAAVPGAFRDDKSFRKLCPDALEQKTNKGKTTPRHAFFEDCARFVELDAALEHALEARLLGLHLDWLDWCRAERERRKRALRVRSFDDLLTDLAHALRVAGGEQIASRLRATLPVALIDEFQDTDPLQYEIFQRIWNPEGGSDGASGEGALFLIGDPKQAIYAFRGADVFAYMRARRDAGADDHTLTINWRSDPGLIRGLNTLFGRVEAPFLFEQIAFRPAEARPNARDALRGATDGKAPLQLLFVRREEADKALAVGWARLHGAPRVAAHIARLLASEARIEETSPPGGELTARRLEAGDIAVLCRSNRQAQEMQDALAKCGVPGVLQTQKSVFESEEAEEIERLLRAFATPGDLRLLRAALTTRVVGVDAHALGALDASDEEAARWLVRFARLAEIGARSGPIACLQTLFDEVGVAQRLLQGPGGERRLTNLLHLGELLQRSAQREGLGPTGSLRWIERMRSDEEARRRLEEEAEIRLETDAHAVQLLTVHRSKGLQFPVVYCPYLWQDASLRRDEKQWPLYHDPEAEQKLTLDLGPKEDSAHEAHEMLAAREAAAESMRLLYVALSRAKHRLVVVWGVFNGAWNSPLGRLLHPAPAGSEDSEEERKRRILERDDEALERELEELAASSDGAIEVRPLDHSSPRARRSAPAQASALPLEARHACRALSSRWRTSSFSGLSSAAEESHRALDAHDHDERARAGAEGMAAEGSDGERVLLHDFPAGPGPGTLIHEIFEHLDFERADERAIRDVLDRCAARERVDSEAQLQTLCRALGEVLSTPLGGDAGDFSLREIGCGERRSEMEFVLPVRHERAAPPLLASELAAVFESHGVDARLPGCSRDLAELGFAPLEGHLRGFIDLVWRRDERFYLVDYKSNQLGPQPADYGSDSLAHAMRIHHYALQSHLYLVALHRYLHQRLPGYDYERHMGGAYYLFLRGMSPRHAPGCGIYHDRPSQALIDDLSALFETGDADAAGGATRRLR